MPGAGSSQRNAYDDDPVLGPERGFRRDPADEPLDRNVIRLNEADRHSGTCLGQRAENGADQKGAQAAALPGVVDPDGEFRLSAAGWRRRCQPEHLAVAVRVADVPRDEGELPPGENVVEVAPRENRERV
jgi:hypothetical protein